MRRREFIVARKRGGVAARGSSARAVDGEASTRIHYETSCDVLVLTKGPTMALSRVQMSVLGIGAAVLLATQNINTRAEAQDAASGARGTTTSNPITGEGLPNPAPVVTRNWGQLPAGRKWGTTAGPSTVDPMDGNICLRAPARQLPAGGPVDCGQHAGRSHLGFPDHRKTGAVSRTSARALWSRRGPPWTSRATCGSPICGQQGGHQGASGPSSPEG
jgi:hypothetical protein